MEPERAEPELKGAEAEPEPELRAVQRTLMASRFLFGPDSFSVSGYKLKHYISELVSLFVCFMVCAELLGSPHRI